MAIDKETSFIDAVTVVTAEWLNLLQQHLAGLATLEVTAPTPTQVRIAAGNDDAVASVYIGGEQRYRDTNASFTFTTEPAATYSVYVTAPAGVDSFSMDVRSSGTPTTTPYRKVAEVVWNGAAITQIRVSGGRNLPHDHSPLGGAGIVSHTDVTGPTSGDPHTQYPHVSGSRAYSAPVSGVAPAAPGGIATKGYIDGIVAPGLPVGTILPWAGDIASIPAGWLHCDGTSYAVASYGDLHAVIGYAFGGAGANFNVPNLVQRFPLGKTAAGVGSTLGGTGGLWGHTHTQPTHAHTTAAHVHTTTAHSHSFPTTGGPSAEHSHAQGDTGSSGTHSHSGPSHSHGAGTLAVGASGVEIVGSVHASSATAGIYREDDLDQFTAPSHLHDNGSFSSSVWGAVCGSTAANGPSHNHAPAGNSYEHTHTAGSVAGSTAAGGTEATTDAGAHVHTNPSSSTSSEGHTHSGGTSGSASPSVNSGGGGGTSSNGDEVTGSAHPPYILLNYIIRAEA